MNGPSHVRLRSGVALLVAMALLVAGAGATYLVMRSSEPDAADGAAGASGAAAGSTDRAAAPLPPVTSKDATNAPLPDVVVPLTDEAVARAGIVVAPVGRGTITTELRLPGVVEPNAYRQVAVTPIVSGRITGISVELGDRVRRGQTLAQVYSPDLADAQTRYVSARAALEAHVLELRRTRKLVEIGAASRQELERLDAEHTAQTANVRSAQSRLELLGVPVSTLEKVTPGTEVEATVNVPAPIAGVVIERSANIGVNVDPAAKLFTVVDLSTVWVVADLFEKDFSRVHVGSTAVITTTAYPGTALEGAISYIDPQINPDTRTARVRVEVPNSRGQLRLGMYAEVIVSGGAPAAVPVIPRSAVQNVGDRTVVYLANPERPGTFTEREVRLRPSSGDQVEVLAGLQPGDMVVTAGSFFVRAERERLGLGRGAEPAGIGRR
jgi:RND family efflux transporter MFP subunit